MDLLQALAEIPNLIERYQQATAKLEAAQKELERQKNDKYVTYEWVCDFFGLDRKTVNRMLQDEQVFAYGRQIKRFRRSAILAFAERHSLKVKDLKES